MMYANGYDIRRVITVAMREYSIEMRKISLYPARPLMLSRVKLPAESVKE